MEDAACLQIFGIYSPSCSETWKSTTRPKLRQCGFKVKAKVLSLWHRFHRFLPLGEQFASVCRPVDVFHTTYSNWSNHGAIFSTEPYHHFHSSDCQQPVVNQMGNKAFFLSDQWVNGALAINETNWGIHLFDHWLPDGHCWVSRPACLGRYAAFVPFQKVRAFPD